MSYDYQVLVDWRYYLIRRRYARETVRVRVAVARRWCGWVADWRACGYGDVEAWVGEQPVSPAAQRNLISNLRAFYRWAMRERHLEADPTALVDPPRVPATLPRPAVDAHIAHVLAGAGVELAAIVGLMACAGLRCVEVARLRWRDVDLAAGTAFVDGKGRRERVVHLSAEIVALLAALDGIDGPLFASPAGRQRSPAAISQQVCRAFRTAGYPTRAHQLRHRAATAALAVPGSNLLAVRDMLGHASVATTQIYTKLVPGLSAAVARSVPLPDAV